MRVAQLWRYPVKSFLGETESNVVLSPLGIVGDRHWAIRDHERGGIRGAKKIGELMQLAARYVDEDTRVVEITFPDGRRVRSDDPATSDALTRFLGRRVSLESLPDNGDLEHFMRGPGDSEDPVVELRSIFGRDDDEPLPNFAAFPPEVAMYESPPGTHHDCWPLMVMTVQALESLRRALPQSVVDLARFRPSLLIDTGEPARGEGITGHPEFSWTGRRAVIGDATIEFLDPCPRCVMVTRKIDESIPEDRAVLRHIVRDLDQNLGIYARIIDGGAVRVGDTMRFV